MSKQHNTYQAWTGFAVSFTFDDDGNRTSVHVDGPDEGDPFPRIGPTCWATGPDYPDGEWVYDNAATGSYDDVTTAVVEYAASAAEIARKQLDAGADYLDDMAALLDELTALDAEAAANARTDTDALWQAIDPRIARWRDDRRAELCPRPYALDPDAECPHCGRRHQATG